MPQLDFSLWLTNLILNWTFWAFIFISLNSWSKGVLNKEKDK
jgi:peptidoglycan biosynthesis protein MviN/MurJ (putative lipid II flippase)